MNKNIIATFHKVEDQIWFDNTMQYLSKNYKVVNTEDLYSIMNSGRQFGNILHLTIDDGHFSFYNTIFPVLQKYNLPATLFVSPKICGERKNFWFQIDKNLDQVRMIKIISDELEISTSKLDGIPYHPILKCFKRNRIQKILEKYFYETGEIKIPPQNMSIDQLIEVDRSGLVTIGAHTMNHPILSNESDETAENEIVSSISNLQSILGHPVDYFAYPNGLPNLDFGQREIDILKNNNIKLAFSGKFQGFNIRSNLYCLPRMGFSNGSENTLRMKILLGVLWPYFKALRNKPEVKIREDITNIISKF